MAVRPSPVPRAKGDPTPVDGLLAAPQPDRAARLRDALAPAGIYVGVRLLGVVVLGVMAARNGSTLVGELTSWDGEWLLIIAEFGYDDVPTDFLTARRAPSSDNPRGFFPGYPALVALVALLTGGNVVAAGLVVTHAAGIVAAYGLARLGEIVPGGSRRAGLLLVGLFAATPMAVVLSMTYSEALLCALAVWALVAVLTRRWIAAALLTVAAGLVRPTATALIAAVGLAAVVAALAGHDIETAGPPPARIGPWLCVLLAPAGWLGYLGYVAVRTGEPLGWFRVQRVGWGWYVDGGPATARFVRETLAGGVSAYEVATVLVLLGGLVLVGLAVRMRLPWPLLVYAGVALATVWGTDGVMNTKIRLLIPAFVLLLPIAIGLARRRGGTAVGVLVAVALGSAWFGGHALTVWPYGI